MLSDTAGVNEEELADFGKDIVHVVGRLTDDSFRPLQTNVPVSYTHLGVYPVHGV